MYAEIIAPVGATRKVLLLENPKTPYYIRPTLNLPYHSVQSYVLDAPTPAVGCHDHSKPLVH